MYICVDFDGTIVDHQFPEIGKPVPGAIDWLKKLQKQGVEIILFTMRSDNHGGTNFLSEAVDYLKKQGVELFGINRNPAQRSWTSSPKAYGHVYIDDAAFGCPLIHPTDFARPCVDWSVVGPEIERLYRQSILNIRFHFKSSMRYNNISNNYSMYQK